MVPAPLVVNVGARDGWGLPFSLDGQERANLATYIVPSVLPLPEPSRSTLPSLKTRMMPSKFGLPFIVSLPVTSSNPAPPSRLQSPLTKVILGAAEVPA